VNLRCNDAVAGVEDSLNMCVNQTASLKTLEVGLQKHPKPKQH
jgi:hypothetical protein